MERGFWIILGGIAIIALGYAALSVWPVLTEVPSQQSGFSAQGPGITPVQPQSPRTSPPPQGQAQTQAQGQGNPGPAAPAPGMAPPPAAGPGPGAPPAPAGGSPTNRRSPSPKPKQGPKLMTGPIPQAEAAEPEPAVDLRYTRDSVKLYVEPNGRFHSPPSLNNNPLIIARGSHVLPLEYRDGWVMVRSPGNTLGWLHDEDLTDQPPITLAQEILY